MSRADELKAKAARTSARRTAAQETTEPTAPPSRVRARPVRKTVDLPPARYAALTEWCAETAQQLGVARVTGQDALAGLVELLLTDETTARRLRAQLAEHFHRRNLT